MEVERIARAGIEAPCAPGCIDAVGGVLLLLLICVGGVRAGCAWGRGVRGAS